MSGNSEVMFIQTLFISIGWRRNLFGQYGIIFSNCRIFYNIAVNSEGGICPCHFYDVFTDK